MPKEYTGQRYQVVGDFATPLGWIVDWKKYMSYPWYLRLFKRNSCIVEHGKREDLRKKVIELNRNTQQIAS